MATEKDLSEEHAQTVSQLGAVLIAEMKRSDELRDAEMHRLDELRNAEQHRVDERMGLIQGNARDLTESERRHMANVMQLRSEYTEKLSIAEAKRIDAIRAVDVNAVAIANERSAAQAIVLANQVSNSADTLRTLVATTAAAQATQIAQQFTQLTDRLALLEKSQYEQKGTVTGSPQLDRIMALERGVSQDRGNSGGQKDMYGWFFGGLMGVISIGSFIYMLVSKAN